MAFSKNIGAKRQTPNAKRQNAKRQYANRHTPNNKDTALSEGLDSAVSFCRRCFVANCYAATTCITARASARSMPLRVSELLLETRRCAQSTSVHAPSHL